MIYIIDFKNSTSKDIINAYFTSNNITVLQEYDSLGLVYSVESSTTPPTTDSIERISQDTDVAITPLISYKSFPITEDDEHWWKVCTVNIKDFEISPVKHPINQAKVNVYILDSGIKADHQEFANVNITNLYSYDGTFEDTHGHGTAIASLVSGSRCSLAEANIKVVKIFGDTPTYQSHILAALDAVIKDNALDRQPGVANLSWNIPKNNYIEAKLQSLIDNNILVVCAAGNNGIPIADVTPASMLDVITVGSFNKEFEPSNFSNYTSPNALTNTNNAVNYGMIDIWAPGEHILVATLDGGYNYAAGTSLSSAIETMALAYQLGDRYATEGILDEELTFGSLKYYYSGAECSKGGLLTLTGNYISSINLITNVHSQYTNPSNFTTRFFPFIRVRAEHSKDFCQAFYLPRYSSSFEVSPGLPPGTTIENGWIKGNITLADNETHKFIEFTVTHHDDTGNYSASQSVGLFVFRRDVDYTQDPTVDPTLTIEPAVTVFYCNNNMVPSYGNGYCGDTCISAIIYCIDVNYFCFGSKTNSCQCAAVCP